MSVSALRSEPIEPAPRYVAVDDLAIVTCHFNPSGYRSRLDNFARFREPIVASGLQLFVVECTFGERERELPPAWDVTHLRARDIMWQKERLLNIVVRRLPRKFTKVAWIDADVLFANPNWAVDTSQLLGEFAVVQLFEEAIRLPRGRESFAGAGERYAGFASVYANEPHGLLGGQFAEHGHTGFGWAARRELFETHGLYDACISGCGDHIMAHAFCGDWESPCIGYTFGRGAMVEHFQAWCERVYTSVRARVGFVPGTALHLWHGDLADRKYDVRNRELIAMGFDPARHLVSDASECLQWQPEAAGFRQWATDYFDQRREDAIQGAPR